MPKPAQQPGKGMMNFVGQLYPAPNATNAQMMQQPAQQSMPMMDWCLLAAAEDVLLPNLY
jgi:hypothetical protein